MYILKRTKRKLKSENGASIAFGLFLFLICMVISSIVIVAATAVSGRLSNLAKMDQKYYFVNSIAENIKREFDEQTIFVEKNKITLLDEDGDKKTGSENVQYTITYKDVSGKEIQPGSLMVSIANYAVFGIGNPTTLSESEYDVESVKTVESSVGNTYNVVFTDEKSIARNATLSYVYKTDGKLYISITDNIDSKENYTLNMVFTIENTTSEHFEKEVIDYNNNQARLIETNSFGIKWNLREITKGK